MESRTTHQKKRRALRQPRARHGHSPRSPARASPARLGAVEVSARARAAVEAPSEGAFIRRRLLSLVAPAACPLTNSNLMPTPNHRLAPPRGRVMTCLSAHARRRPPPPTAAAAAAALRAQPRPAPRRRPRVRLMTTARQQQLLLPPSPVDRPHQVSSRIRARAPRLASLLAGTQVGGGCLAGRACPRAGPARPCARLPFLVPR